MAYDILYHLRRAETEAVRAIGCDSNGVAAVHMEMCVLYAKQAIAGMLATADGRGGGVALTSLAR